MIAFWRANRTAVVVEGSTMRMVLGVHPDYGTVADAYGVGDVANIFCGMCGRASVLFRSLWPTPRVLPNAVESWTTRFGLEFDTIVTLHV